MVVHGLAVAVKDPKLVYGDPNDQEEATSAVSSISSSRLLRVASPSASSRELSSAQSRGICVGL